MLIKFCNSLELIDNPMRVKLRERRCRRDLSVSAKIGGKIFYVFGNQIHAKSIVDPDKSKAVGDVFQDEISYIAAQRGNLVLLFGNTLRTYVVGVDTLSELDSAVLHDIPTRVCCCGDALIFLFRDNRLQIKRRVLRTVDVVADSVYDRVAMLVDVCSEGDKTYWLARDGRMFETECIGEHRTLRLGRPLLMLPNTEDAVCEHIAVSGALAVVAGSNCCAVYRKCGRALVLKYTYAGVVHCVQSYRRSVFCSGHGLLRMDDAPEMVLEGHVERFFGEIVVFHDRIAFIEDKEPPVCARDGVALLHEQNAWARAERLLAPVVGYDLERVLGAPGSTVEDVLKRVADELAEIYNNIHVELHTLEQSFREKERVLGLKYRELVRSVDSIDERKACIVRKQNDLILGTERLWAGIRCGTDTGCTKEKIAQARESIVQMAPLRNSALLRTLRAQRSVLESRVQMNRAHWP